MRRRYVSQAAMPSMKLAGTALFAVLALSAFAVGQARAEPCAEACRSQHNSCRMAAKLLFSGRCDAQLQACITQCFAAARFGRDGREGHDPRDMRDPRGMHGPGDMRGPPDMRDRGMGGTPGMHGPPRDFRDQRGPRFLGGGDRRF